MKNPCIFQDITRKVVSFTSLRRRDKDTMSGSILPLLLLLIPAEITASSVPELIYSCNPSGTITVDNPDIATYRSASAKTVDGTTNCKVTFLFFHRTILISGCPISRNISLWFHDGPTEPEIITSTTIFYTIRCQQIPATGIYRRVTDESWVTNEYASVDLKPNVTSAPLDYWFYLNLIHASHCQKNFPNVYKTNGVTIQSRFVSDLVGNHIVGFPTWRLIWYVFSIKTTVEPSVIPLITLETEIQDFDDRYKRTKATIGELLRWEIVGPINYYVLPLNCSAKSGDLAEQCALVLDGCSQDLNLLSHFSREVDRTHIIYADLFAFRFASNNRILLICDMLGCNNQSSACDINCPGDKKRRDVSTDENLDETGQAQNIIFRREVVLEGGRVVRDTRDSDSEPGSNRPTRNEGEEKGPVRDGGELVGQIKTGLQIIDPVLAKSVALLVERGSAAVPVVSAVLLTVAALVSLML